MALIELRKATFGYGERVVFQNLDFALAPGRIVGVFGWNGAGKTTLLKALSGLVAPWSGSLVFDGEELLRPTIQMLFRRGVVLVPPAGRVFESLTVRKNIEVAAGQPSAWPASIERTRVLFPELIGRMESDAMTLSGGERQLLALASALASRPKVLLLDEPLIGLAPSLIPRVAVFLTGLCAESGVAAVVTDHSPDRLGDAVDLRYLLADCGLCPLGAPSR